MGEIMINRIVITRIEPCFMATKPVSGELSRVKKDNINSSQVNIQQTPRTDTFTSAKDNKEVNSEKNNGDKIEIKKGNAE